MDGDVPNEGQIPQTDQLNRIEAQLTAIEKKLRTISRVDRELSKALASLVKVLIEAVDSHPQPDRSEAHPQKGGKPDLHLV